MRMGLERRDAWVKKNLPDEVETVERVRPPTAKHLAEIMRKRDGVALTHLPLTIGEARRSLGTLMSDRQTAPGQHSLRQGK